LPHYLFFVCHKLVRVLRRAALLVAVEESKRDTSRCYVVAMAKSIEDTMNESLDYMGKRVVTAAVFGGVLGGCLATYKGHAISMVAPNMARSWALCTTACTLTQQLALGVLSNVLPFSSNKNDTAAILISHGVGGICGGSVLGYLYIRKPVRGMVFMAPIMLAIGMLELRYQERQEQQFDRSASQATLRTDGSRIRDAPVDLEDRPRRRPH
jgi:hypothetical protein